MMSGEALISVQAGLEASPQEFSGSKCKYDSIQQEEPFVEGWKSYVLLIFYGLKSMWGANPDPVLITK